jgi:hypothetical protein
VKSKHDRGESQQTLDLGAIEISPLIKSNLSPYAIGDIGEYVAKKYLFENGFELVRFDPGLRKEVGCEKFNAHDLPIARYFLGHSFGCFSLQEAEWQESLLPKWIDFDYDLIRELAAECNRVPRCKMRDAKPGSAPCANIEKILDKEWLTNIEPSNPLFSSDDSGEVLKGYNLVEICLARFTDILLEHNKNVLPFGKHFLLVHMLVSEYIQRYWWQFCEENESPRNSLDEVRAQMKLGKTLAEVLKGQSKEPLKKVQGSGSHPGRYDFIGYKNGKLYALEVKTNTGDLNYWQTVRLALMARYGCNVGVVRVNIEDEQLEVAAKGHDFHFSSVCIDSAIDASKVELPTDDEFLKVINYVAKHEKNSDKYEFMSL